MHYFVLISVAIVGVVVSAALGTLGGYGAVTADARRKGRSCADPKEEYFAMVVGLQIGVVIGVAAIPAAVVVWWLGLAVVISSGFVLPLYCMCVWIISWVADLIVESCARFFRVPVRVFVRAIITLMRWVGRIIPGGVDAR